MIKKTLYLVLMLLFFTVNPQAATTWTDYEEIPNPAIKTCMESMNAHQTQWNFFHLYTMNLDVPGYIEIGGYNQKVDGKITCKPFMRWRSGPPQETANPLDFFIEARNKGFFCVRLPSGGEGYTRDGRFKIDNKQRLIMRAGGLPVLGEGGKQIIMPPGKDVAVSKAGVIFMDNVPVDKFKMTVFLDEKDMRDGIETINGCVFYLTKVIPIDPNPEYAIRQGFLEQQNTLKALTGDIIAAKYANEASAKVARMSTKTMTSAVQMANP